MNKSNIAKLVRDWSPAADGWQNDVALSQNKLAKLAGQATTRTLLGSFTLKAIVEVFAITPAS